ncbi:5-methylcytosine-specific restriction enzyme B [Pseudomonas aeruginosa]|uniref:McrB family protein n=1 Tax=Pseudomonas aeruginosa TaxID=287 RepID=UPI000DEF815F|nr:AAA family ATPase [Pseudomonas aeruginosa]RCM97457.1 5-methylcytosine-specific restriction enzyme B [Pseudomonas aeruginosa]
MALLDLLRSNNKQTCEAERVSALAELGRLFPDTEWGIDVDFNYYTQANIDNLWGNEIRRGIKNKIESAGLTEVDYREWLGDVHFLNIGVYRKSLFDRYRSNAGWRLIVMGLPRVGAILVGLASHYQNAQNHNKLGDVSNLLFDIASDALVSDGQNPMYGRKISNVDWDQNGLFPAQMSSIAGVSIAPEVVYLKDIRTTTLKKILASFISVKVLPNSVTQADLHQELEQLAASAKYLSAKVYPFGGLEEFEALRALALQDLAAAGTRLLLRKKSSTRSIVRVYYGPPGTGKTLSAVREAVKIVEPGFDDRGNPTVSFDKFNDYREQCAFITFHPSLQYEDLVESIRPVISEDDLQKNDDGNQNNLGPKGQLRYRVHEGLLLRMIRRALQAPGKEFVIVIDEINRGDLSRILGPLISTLESDKRVGAEFPIGIELQHPRAEELESRLFMPSNLHLIGTMNSSDRNIALVDHALRRRFDFIQIPPEPALLRDTVDTPSVDCGRLLRTLNARIEHLLDADHCIGHGYFVGCDTNAKVVERFASKIIPLLREYFYGNESLILLVLGDSNSQSVNFFKINSADKKFENIFGIAQDVAAAFGYRPHSTPKSLELDSRFWNPARVIPGPDNETYAVSCLLKLCQSGSTFSTNSNEIKVDTNEAPTSV